MRVKGRAQGQVSFLIKDRISVKGGGKNEFRERGEGGGRKRYINFIFIDKYRFEYTISLHTVLILEQIPTNYPSASGSLDRQKDRQTAVDYR